MSTETESPTTDSAPEGEEQNTSGQAPAAPAEVAAAQGQDAAPQAAAAEGEPAGDLPGDDAGDEVEGEGEGDASDASDAGEGAGAGEGADASGEGEPGKKKKRRRRKKKKPGEGAEGSGAEPRDDASKHRPHRPATERAPFHVGEEVFGKVTAVLDTAVMVDLSGKALAIFDRTEMEADDLVPSVGDRFVARIHNDGVRGGLVVLTRKPLREEEIKPAVEAASKDGSLVQGLVTGVIKGGVEVDISGLRAFAPASGMDLHPQNANFTGLVGQRLDFKVIQYKNAGRDVVVSRRPMLEAEAHERRKHALTLLTEGQVLKGIVRTVVEWGAFVALPEAENLEGLVHISEASHDARARMADLVRPGAEVEVKILKIDEKGKIWLSRKALIEDPWAAAREKYAQGSRHTGKVQRLLDFGAFVELEPGVEGLIHITDLSLTRIEHPNEVLKEGQDVDVVVSNFDTRTKKIALHPAPPPERADEAPQKVARNAVVKVEVIKHEASGLIVRILGVTGRAARGFLPAGQTGTPRGTDLRKHFKMGSILDVKVLEVDPRRGEPKLSIKAMAEDEERRAHREYRQALQKEGGFGTLGDLLKKKLGG
ncbi:MAG: 30S ribosomal protein S1 [Polyangiaceae bacterium]|nr:30S ribosomal protein S1 [Polyangiaceae bacterium]MCL4756494.1 S1 RNA-binding domain-containing protein [Myxococcales bacterium]